ncbi:MAG: hypothetical protein QNJ42_05935 [Crocosphaera sp.]|nr:hypothetical protein [Crocosphaera sp.]
MKSDRHQSIKCPQSRPQTFIHPLVWSFFISSTLLFITVVFLTTGTSTGPTFFSPKELKEQLKNINF